MPHDDLPKTFTIPGVEILRTGTWNGTDFSLDDLDAIAESHAALKESGFLVPRVTIDHDETKTRSQGDGGPALGFVDSVQRVGERLIATLIKVPSMLADAIRRENFQPRSVEVWWDVELGGREFPAVLSVLSFLGADLPAVSGLADIEQLYEEQTEAVTALSGRVPDGIKTTVVRLSAHAETRDPKTEINVELAKILEALGMDAGADEAAVMAKLSELMTPAAPAEPVEPEPEQEPVAEPVEASETLSLRKDNGELLARVTKLEKDIAKRDADSAVDVLVRCGKLLPKQSEKWVKLKLSDPALFASMSDDLEVQIDLKEHGHSDAADADPFAPSKDELAFAQKVDPSLTADDLTNTKRRAAGEPELVTSSQES